MRTNQPTPRGDIRARLSAPRRLRPRAAGLAIAALATAAAIAAPACGLGTGGIAKANPVVGSESNLTASAQSTGTHDITIQLSLGNPNPGEGGQPKPTWKVTGVTITLERLAGLDPANKDDIAKVTDAAVTEVVTQWPKAEKFSAVTDGTGTAHFSGLPVGLYAVTSTAPDDSADYRKIQPFVMAIPFFDGLNGDVGQGVIIAKPSGPTPPPDVPPDVPPVVPPPFPPIPHWPHKPHTPPNPSTPPSQPPAPPTQPNQPPTPPTPPNQPPTPPTHTALVPRLPVTGANVIWLVAVAGLLTLTGAFLLITNMRDARKRGK